MPTLRRIGTSTAVLVAMLCAPAPARADESDNFTCRARLTRDSLGALDALMNSRIQAALDLANRRGAAACGANCLLSALQKHIGASALDPRTLVPHARFAQWITRQPALDRCHLKFGDTIYGARPYDQPWLFPFQGRVIFVADSILLSGRVVGLDKINHFIREGLEHWRDATGRGRDIASILDEELGSPARKFRWTEYGLKGWSLTGVLAYADLAAGYSGFQFWTDLLSIGGTASYVGWDASSGRFVQTRPFTFATYVNDAWDEGINYSAFQPGLGREVSAALARRTLSMPVRDCRSLASLPDARLYVNPACLLPDLERLPSFEERLQAPAAGRMAQLAQRLRLDLPDALARDREALADLFERVLGALADAEAHLDHTLLTRRERLEDAVGLFLQVQVDHGLRRRHDVRVGDEVAKMRIFLLANRRLE
jgi:hypothetical protein